MRSRSLQALTDAIKRRHPGVVIYGIGDEEHQERPSDHNEDDTPGSRPAQTDADNDPEHRGIDVMLGPAFSRAQAYALIADLLADPAALAQLFYILFNGWRWSRTTGWERVEFDGDPHDDHVHISGWAPADESTAGWPAIERGAMALADDVWNADVIPAARKPYNNGDLETNPKWQAKYALQVAVEGARAANANAAAALTAAQESERTLHLRMDTVDRVLGQVLASGGVSDAQLPALADLIADRLLARVLTHPAPALPD